FAGRAEKSRENRRNGCNSFLRAFSDAIYRLQDSGRWKLPTCENPGNLPFWLIGPILETRPEIRKGWMLPNDGAASSGDCARGAGRGAAGRRDRHALPFGAIGNAAPDRSYRSTRRSVGGANACAIVQGPFLLGHPRDRTAQGTLRASRCGDAVGCSAQRYIGRVQSLRGR